MRPRGPTHPQIKLLLVEDDGLIRTGLLQTLKNFDIIIVGEAVTAKEAMDKSARLKPDIILMDITLPDCSGIIAAARIRKSSHAARVIMFSSDDDEELVRSSLAAGASGYCVKGMHLELLALAIRSVHAGAVWLDSAIATRVLADYSREKQQEDGATNMKDQS